VTVAKTILPAAEEPSLRRWMIAGTTVVIIHAAIALWLIYLRETNTSVGEPPTEVMIELAPLPVAPPSDTPPEITPGPQMKQAEPEEAVEPQQTIAVPALPPAPKPAVVLMTAPKPTPKPKPPKKVAKKVEKLEREPPAPRTSAPPHSKAAPARTAAVPRQGSSGPSAASIASWRSQVYAHLVRYKPGTTSVDGSGTASLSFTINRSGSIVSSRLSGSTGSSTLDQKALEMVRRANPFPAPPSEVGGGSFTFSVPVHFSGR
jgi:periplasmic protein TonB